VLVGLAAAVPGWGLVPALAGILANARLAAKAAGGLNVKTFFKTKLSDE